MSSYSKLISHPHQRLENHLQSCDTISALALQRKYLNPVILPKKEVDHWRRLLVYFHDFGKSTKYFQHKIIKAVKNENPGYAGVDQEYIESFYQLHDAFRIEEDIANYEGIGSHALLGAYVVQVHDPRGNDTLLRAILSAIIKRHHGNLKNFRDEFEALEDAAIEKLQKQWSNSNLPDYELILTKQAFRLPEELSGLLLQYGGVRFQMAIQRQLPAKDVIPYFQTLFLFSLLLAADKGDMMLGAEREGVGRVVPLSTTLIDRYKTKTFGAGAHKDIDRERESAYCEVAATLYAHPDAPFYSITLPTGMGKTLTAYNAAIQLQNTIKKQYDALGQLVTPRIIYCLPFTSVIDQNAAILEEILQLDDLQNGHLARHHYLSDWPTARDEQEGLNESEQEYLVEGWEYSLTVTTFVQLLETIFSNRNRKLRKFHNLANAIIILDEVQNIPPKYFESVETAFIAMHQMFNTRFLFVTATQPILINQHPVIELTDPLYIKTRAFFENRERIELDLSLWLEPERSLEELCELFQSEIEEKRDRSFLFILNKVKESQAVFSFLKKRNENAPVTLVYLSAAVLPVLRKERIDAVRNHGAKTQLIVVSTQVVEAGVDIDLDIVYRAFAPLDSINQSAGRCNRNGLKGKGKVCLFPSPKSGRSIYDAALLNITQKVLDYIIHTNGSAIIPESKFYDLNNLYAREVRRVIADQNNASEIIDRMRNLEFENVNHAFKLIRQDYEKYSVFIDFDESAHLVWQKYLEIRKEKDRWERKKKMRKIRPQLLQYIVQFPGYASPPHFQKESEERGIVYLSQEHYPLYYDLEFGYLSSLTGENVSEVV